jgi:hypothetical protein
MNEEVLQNLKKSKISKRLQNSYVMRKNESTVKRGKQIHEPFLLIISTVTRLGGAGPEEVDDKSSGVPISGGDACLKSLLLFHPRF